jgi:hypothetical protein
VTSVARVLPGMTPDMDAIGDALLSQLSQRLHSLET